MSECSTDGNGTADAGEHKHEALFAHVGVTDRTDWRAVALQLAKRYVPDLLNEVHTNAPASKTKKVGRPKKWTSMHDMLFLTQFDMVKEASRNKRIQGNLTTNSAVCRYLASSSPEAKEILAALGLKPGISAGRLDNLRREAIRRQYGVAANENSR